MQKWPSEADRPFTHSQIAGFFSHSLGIVLVESIKPLSLADLRGGHEGCAPPGSKFFQFHAVSGKIWQNHMLAPPLPGGLAPPPRRNPGSATGSVIGFGDSAVSGFSDFNVYDWGVQRISSKMYVLFIEMTMNLPIMLMLDFRKVRDVTLWHLYLFRL